MAAKFQGLAVFCHVADILVRYATGNIRASISILLDETQRGDVLLLRTHRDDLCGDVPCVVFKKRLRWWYPAYDSSLGPAEQM